MITPGVRVVAKPDGVSIFATAGFNEDHAASDVRDRVVPSENNPSRENCCVRPATISASWGEIRSDISSAGVIVSLAAPKIFSEAAVTTTSPARMAVPNPFVSIDRTDGSEEVKISPECRAE